MQETAFLLQLMYFPLEDIFDRHKFFILLYGVIECLLQKLIVQFLLLKQPNKICIRFYFLTCFLLLLFFCFLIDATNEVSNLHRVFLLVLFQYFLNFWVLIDDNVFHLRKEVKVFLHFFALILVVVLFLDEVGNELVDVLISDFFLEAVQFIIHGWLRKILVFFEPLHNRSKRFLLIMQVFPQINDFVLKLAHPFMVKLFVLQSHLLLHQQRSIDVHVLIVILSQLGGQFCLCVEEVQAFLVAAHDSEEGLLVECQVFLQV